MTGSKRERGGAMGYFWPWLPMHGISANVHFLHCRFFAFGPRFFEAALTAAGKGVAISVTDGVTMMGWNCSGGHRTPAIWQNKSPLNGGGEARPSSSLQCVRSSVEAVARGSASFHAHGDGGGTLFGGRGGGTLFCHAGIAAAHTGIARTADLRSGCSARPKRGKAMAPNPQRVVWW